MEIIFGLGFLTFSKSVLIHFTHQDFQILILVYLLFKGMYKNKETQK